MSAAVILLGSLRVKLVVNAVLSCVYFKITLLSKLHVAARVRILPEADFF